MEERTLRHQPHKVVWQIPRRTKIFCEEDESSLSHESLEDHGRCVCAFGRYVAGS